MSNKAIIKVSATTDHLAEIRTFVREHVMGLGFNDTDENNIVLAVDEACSNLIQHAYHNNPDKQIHISIEILPTIVRVEISDTSAPFDPASADLPDMRRYFIERRHHGLGILLMTRVMDDIQYRPSVSEMGQNTLVLTKRRHP